MKAYPSQLGIPGLEAGVEVNPAGTIGAEATSTNRTGCVTQQGTVLAQKAAGPKLPAPCPENLPATEVIRVLPYNLEHRSFNQKVRIALQCKDPQNSPGITFDQTEIAFILNISHQRVSMMEKHGLKRLRKGDKGELEVHLSD